MLSVAAGCGAAARPGAELPGNIVAAPGLSIAPLSCAVCCWFAESGRDALANGAPTNGALALAIGRFARVGIRVEASAAASLAALDHFTPTEGPVVLVVTGRNIDDELFARACNSPESFAS